MDKFKVFYNEKNGKMILFFGFYLIFFIFLGIYIRNIQSNKPENNTSENQVEEKITSYNMSNLINNDYSYNINITDGSDTLTFKGTKNNVDYANYPDKYFLDIYNINQLLKKSKFIDSENRVLSYEINSSELNDILLTNKPLGVNKIYVHVNKDAMVQKIVMDLTSYMEKEFIITIDYSVGGENENNIS